MAKIKFVNVNKSFEGKPALKNLNLAVNDGEILTFLGATGSGKSTILRIVSGLDSADSGDIYADDTLINNLVPKVRNMAIIFKNAALNPQMNVFDNIAMSLRLRKIPQPEIEVRVRWAAKIMGVSDCLVRKPKTLFGAQKTRVAFARAIVREPNAILLDEPFSDLDATLTRQMRAELVKLQKRLKMTVLYATRDQIEALTVSDRIAVINEGEIEQVDTPRNLYLYPRSVFVATYIGSPTINLAIATISCENEEYTLNVGDTKIALDKAVVSKISSISDYSNTNKNLFLAVRSEYLSFSNDGEFTSVIDSIEDTGSSTLYYVKIKGGTDLWAIKAESGLYKVSDEVKFTINKDNMMLFDKESEISVFDDVLAKSVQICDLVNTIENK